MGLRLSSRAKAVGRKLDFMLWRGDYPETERAIGNFLAGLILGYLIFLLIQLF